MKIPKSGRRDISGKRKKQAALTLDIDDARQAGTGLKQQLKAHTDIFSLTGDDLYIYYLFMSTDLGYIAVLRLTHINTINKILSSFPATGLTKTFLIKVLRCNREKDD